jgi:hypothetical protein
MMPCTERANFTQRIRPEEEESKKIAERFGIKVDETF